MVKVHLTPPTPVHLGSGVAQKLVGVARIELATPAMSTRRACPHTTQFRATPCDPPRIWSHLFSFGAQGRFMGNLGPLCMGRVSA